MRNEQKIRSVVWIYILFYIHREIERKREKKKKWIKSAQNKFPSAINIHSFLVSLLLPPAIIIIIIDVYVENDFFCCFDAHSFFPSCADYFSLSTWKKYHRRDDSWIECNRRVDILPSGHRIDVCYELHHRSVCIVHRMLLRSNRYVSLWMFLHAQCACACACAIVITYFIDERKCLIAIEYLLCVGV